MPRRFTILLAVGLLLFAGAWALAQRLEDTEYVPLDHAAINYMQTEPDDPVSRLDHRIETGAVKLAYTEQNGWGYLPALLKELNINPDSQVLVFSKTSIQADRIGPRSPRALYFNDEVSVGYVQNGDLLELTALDATRGVRLYVMNAAQTKQPSLAQSMDCLRCHQGAITMGVPGMVVSSIQPASKLTRDMHGSAFITDQRTPFAERWGGWYVTGNSGAQAHLGNNPSLIDPVRPGDASGQISSNLASLSELFDTAKYPQPGSDIVALLVLEHQVRMTNLLVRIGWDARIALHDGKLNSEGEAALNKEIDELVNYMTFADEDPLKEKVTGSNTSSTGFLKTFPQRGPRDSKGRSLRDFDLNTRVFRYPVSYMIYTAAFDTLPEQAKSRIYRRLYDVLRADSKQTSPEDRQAAIEIIRETKKNLPEYWTAAARQ